MEPITFIVLGVVGGGVLGAVSVAIYFRRGAVSVSTDVDELAVEVERISKAVRRLTMQRVRAAAGDLPPELGAPPPAEAPTPLRPKDELRRKYLGGH